MIQGVSLRVWFRIATACWECVPWHVRGQLQRPCPSGMGSGGSQAVPGLSGFRVQGFRVQQGLSEASGVLNTLGCGCEIGPQSLE